MISPTPGHWRSNADSLDFLTCYTPSACLGSSADSYNPIGHCYTGYKGVLCGQCEAGYTRNTQFQCAKCPPLWQNALLLTISLLAIMFVLVLLLRVTLSPGQSSTTPVSAFFKILASHLQLLLLTLSFELDWPSHVSSLRDITEPVADVASRLLSVDCFLEASKLSSLTLDGLKAVYVYLLTYLALPLAVMGLSYLFWGLRGRRQKAIPTIVVIFFLLHPSLTRHVFSVFQ